MSSVERETGLVGRRERSFTTSIKSSKTIRTQENSKHRALTASIEDDKIKKTQKLLEETEGTHWTGEEKRMSYKMRLGNTFVACEELDKPGSKDVRAAKRS